MANLISDKIIQKLFPDYTHPYPAVYEDVSFDELEAKGKKPLVTS
jgi:hypothetical protein